MTPFTYGIGALVLIIAIGLSVLWLAWKRRPKLTGFALKRMEDGFRQARSQTDPHRMILEADKVLDQALADLGFQGSTGDKLKKIGQYVPNINSLWDAHKLRNRVAHEQNVQLNTKDVERAMRAFETALRSFT